MSRFSKASNPGAPTAAAVIPEAPVHRVVSDWIPDRLLCKRFNVPDPYSGRVVPADSSDAAKRSSKFSDPGIDMFALPDFAGQRTAASVTKPPEQALSGEKDVAAATSDTAEAAAPARPPVDLFKSIFEPSDSEDD